MDFLTPTHIEIGSPRRFGLPFVVFGSFFWAAALEALAICIGMAPLVILLFIGRYLDVWHEGATAVSAFLNVLLVTLYLSIALSVLLSLALFPTQSGNPLIRRIVSPFKINDKDLSQYVVQITFDPRIIKGFRSVLDDSDDVGILRFERDCVAFQGDSISFAIPYAAINGIERISVGWRGLWILGRHTRIEATTLGAYKSLTIGERQSILLHQSWKTARSIYEALRVKAEAAKTDASA